jgi:hypothetical protein
MRGVVNMLDTKIEAIRQGYERFPNVLFFVKQIVELDIPSTFACHILALTAGFLHPPFILNNQFAIKSRVIILMQTKPWNGYAIIEIKDSL